MTVFKVTTVLGGLCWAITRDFGRMKRGSLLALSSRTEFITSPKRATEPCLSFLFETAQFGLDARLSHRRWYTTATSQDFFYEDLLDRDPALSSTVTSRTTCWIGTYPELNPHNILVCDSVNGVRRNKPLWWRLKNKMFSSNVEEYKQKYCAEEK